MEFFWRDFIHRDEEEGQFFVRENGPSLNDIIYSSSLSLCSEYIPRIGYVFILITLLSVFLFSLPSDECMSISPFFEVHPSDT